MGKWADRKAAAKDTVADAVFKVTDKFVRCQSTNEHGAQCMDDKRHEGNCQYPK